MKDVRDYRRDEKVINRWLDAQVGRQWSDVYSDLSKMLDHRSGKGCVFFHDLKWKVEQDCHVAADGKVYENRCYRYGSKNYSEPLGLYVHPETGILMAGGSWRKKYMRPFIGVQDANFIQVDNQFYTKLPVVRKNKKMMEAPVWYENWQEIREEQYRDRTSGELVPYKRKIWHKRQLNHEEVEWLESTIRDRGGSHIDWEDANIRYIEEPLRDLIFQIRYSNVGATLKNTKKYAKDYLFINHNVV